MCGIIGFVGSSGALPVLLSGLETLEYRGYDSAGVALESSQGVISVRRAAGKLSVLKADLEASPLPDAPVGIGHTRWATHGVPSAENAHPHTVGEITLVHNGIIENDGEIRALESSHPWASETDTEAAAWLIQRRIVESGDVKTGIFAATKELRGSFAFGILIKDRPGVLYAIRRGSPLVAAMGRTGGLIASDVTAILPYSDACVYLPEDTLLELTQTEMHLTDASGAEVPVREEKILWSREAARKGGHAHFMHKEIWEEPEMIRRTVSAWLKGGRADFSAVLPGGLPNITGLHIVACGSAMHAGLVGKRLIERLAGIPVWVEIASEFRYQKPILRPGEAVLVISQSGETADTLAALRYAKEQGISTIAMVNVVGSAIAREADATLYTYAGPEIAVATTKAYMVQCALLYLMAIAWAEKAGRISQTESKAYTDALLDGATLGIREVLSREEEMKTASLMLADAEHLFYIGRGLDYALATEGSLKLKEISYLHSEAYAAGELKHGTISLIEPGTPVIALVTEEDLFDKTLSGIREVVSRGGRVLSVVSAALAGGKEIPGEVKLVLPDVPRGFELFPAMTALQLLAYHTACRRGCDVDQPRNLAKSVTVE